MQDNIQGQLKDTIMFDDESQFETKFPVMKIEEPEYCRLNVHYEADPAVVQEKVDEAIATLRNVRVPGFRKGKAPDQAIKMRLRPQINQYVAREMATQAIDDIVFETNIKAIGQPKFSNITMKSGSFSCDVDLFKKPEFTVGELKFDVPKPKMEVDEEALAEKSLFNLRLRVGELLPYEEDDVVELGDQVTYSFVAKIDGQDFDGSVVEGEMYTVGTNRWTGFDQYLLGMKAGETREFDFVFEDGPDNLDGKTAKFSVTIHMGTKRKPHPINEDFYKAMGVENIEELMNKLRTISRTSIKTNLQQGIRAQVAIKLVENNKFEVPKFLVDGEAKHLASRTGLSLENFSEKDRKDLLEQADRNVRLSLILDTVRESEPDSVLNDGEAKNFLIQHIQAQGQNPAELFNNPAARPHLMMLLNSVKDEFTLQWIADQANIIE